MRITTKVIQNNTRTNINNNKVLQDKLSNQMGTQKKINRPSEDPIVAIRALRLRTNVSQVTQYYEKNIPDAKSWMQITEDALSSVTEVITDMRDQCQKGSSEKLTNSDRQTILDALQSLRDEVYATGNADYAGRSVFTGYITDANFDSAPASNIKEADVQEYSIHRIRLAYKNLDDETETIAPRISNEKLDADGNVLAAATVDVTATIVSSKDVPSPYISITEDANKDKAILIKETGELLIGEELYGKLMGLQDDETTTLVDEGEFRVTYEKSNWVTNDLKPEHYFACTDKSDADPLNHISYNPEYLTNITKEKQAIEYDVGLNQSIRVNTTADEVFVHAIGRDVDDMINVLQEITILDAKITDLKKLAEENAADPAKSATLRDQVEAAEKAMTYLNEKRQSLFEHNITNMSNHLDRVNYATTNCGTREKKLELIENRLMSQKTSFEELQSENENIDISDAAIELQGANMAYEAALMATGKILQTSLVNYL